MPPLSSLQKLESLKCSSSTLALFSEVDTLTYVGVRIEKKLTCFPIETLLNFRNLKSLTIHDAQEISVPQQGLQTAFKKLDSLSIRDCKTMKCFPEGLLRHLIALKYLYIESCPEIVELPTEEIKHLHNLKWLQLFDLPKMACLPEALQHLSLTLLNINRLPQLDSLPDVPSLTFLHLHDCAKVASLPLLPNLKRLRIKECPALERRCARGTGEDWHKIAHIRRLQIG